MQQTGRSETEIDQELERRLHEDFTYSSGRIIGSMCTSPHPLAKKIYCRFLEKNLGDAGLFPAATKLEKETVNMLGTLLSNDGASGHIVTGGTEANILALWAAKKLAKKTKPEVIVPASAHCSFDKAADMLGLRIVKAKLNERFQVDLKSVKTAVTSRTIAIVGIAGTTALGIVDPIEDLSELASKKNLYLHVDAAFGGFVLPFLKDLGYNVPRFDFAVPGVCSMTVDPHKMGWSCIPAGGILFRNEGLKKAVSRNISYLSGGEAEQATIVGTRSGASAIAVWALMQWIGREGYRKIIKKCMRLTFNLVEDIQSIKGLNVVMEPTMNVVGLKSEIFDVRQIAEALRLRKWAISVFPHHIRIVLMPHVQQKHLNEFVKDLTEITDTLRK